MPILAKCLSLLLLFPVALWAAEDCPMGKLEIHGKLTSANAPVANARVEIHWDEARASNLSTSGSSAKDGSFRLTFSFETMAGRTLLGKIKCGYQPGHIQLRVKHPDFAEVEQNVSLKNFKKPVLIRLKAKAR